MQKLSIKFFVTDELGNPLSKGKRCEYLYDDLNYLNKDFDKWIALRFVSEYFGVANVSLSVKLWNHDFKKVYESSRIFTIKPLCEQIRLDQKIDSDLVATQALAKKFWGSEL